MLFWVSFVKPRKLDFPSTQSESLLFLKEGLTFWSFLWSPITQWPFSGHFLCLTLLCFVVVPLSWFACAAATLILLAINPPIYKICLFSPSKSCITQDQIFRLTFSLKMFQFILFFIEVYNVTLQCYLSFRYKTEWFNFSIHYAVLTTSIRHHTTLYL